MRVMGLMSGTSMDGVDVAIATIGDGTEPGSVTVALESYETKPYPDAVRDRIASIISSDVIEGTRKSVVRDVCALNFAIGEAFAAAALAVAGDATGTIDLIGSHGQTIYHLPDDDGGPGFARSTLQIGEPAVIAERTGITCVADFRVADVAAGGLGAPLVSYVDHLLLRDAHENRAALNIGGIANLTVLPAGKGIDEINAFDIGPGNMLIDLAAAHFSCGRLRFDERGAIAGAADVSAPLLEWLGAHPYYARRPPKTTGRETFGDAYFRAVLNAARAFGADDAQTIATLTASAARQIAQAMPPSMQRVIVSGGGAFNDTMMAELRAQLAERYAAPPAVSLSGEFGLPPDAKEAMAFAVLAYQTIHGRPSSAPGATGATRARILGKIAPGENFAALMNELSAHRTVRGGAIDPKARV